MVLTRGQRKSGIDVTPTAPDTTRKKRSTRKVKTDVEPAAQEETSSDLPSPIEGDGGLDTPAKGSPRKTSTRGRKSTAKRKTPVKAKPVVKCSPQKNITVNENTSDDDSGRVETTVTDSNIEKSNLPEQTKSDENEIGVDDEHVDEDEGESVGEGDRLSRLEENNHAISNVKGQQLVEESSDDDDDAPESMTFDVGRETALETLHQAYKESLKISSKKKEKRRAHDTMMKEQAKKKVKRCELLDSNRLPETFLTEVNKETSDSHKPSEPETDEIDGGDEDFSDDDDEELFKDNGDDDYVIEKEGFQIVPLQKFAKIPVVKSMAAANYRQEQLYGKRIPRVAAPSQISMSLKRSSKPAMNFKVKGIAVTKKERRQKKNDWANLIK